jgi:serine/alanine adding enzyme
MSDVEVSLADDDDAAHWDGFVAAHPARTAYHLFGFKSLIERVFGHSAYYLKAERTTGDLVGVLPLVRVKSLLFGDFLVSLPFVNYGGPLAELAAELGVAQLELRAQKAYGQGLYERTDKATLLLDLPQEADALWQSFGSKLRAQIRRPQREATDVAVGGLERLDEFHAVLSRNMRDLGTPFHSKRFFAALIALLDDRARLVIVTFEGRPAAAGFLIHHGGRVEVPWASSLRELNHLGVNMLLYWELLKQSVAWRARAFDFGRSTLDSGPYRFKQQWGAEPAPLHYQYWTRSGERPQILAPVDSRFSLAIEIWKHLPVFAAQLMGPRIVRYLP